MAAPARFLTDEHVAHAVVSGLRQRGIDVVSVSEANLIGATDEVLLERARSERRVIVTHDSDFLRLHAKGLSHAGLVYARREQSIGDLIRGLVLIAQVLGPEEMVGQCRVRLTRASTGARPRSSVLGLLATHSRCESSTPLGGF